MWAGNNPIAVDEAQHVRNLVLKTFTDIATFDLQTNLPIFLATDTSRGSSIRQTRTKSTIYFSLFRFSASALEEAAEDNCPVEKKW